MIASSFLFTLEATGRCPAPEAEYWLRMAAHCLTEAGFAVADAQAIGIDGAKGVALEFPDTPAPALVHSSEVDSRRMSDVPGQMQ